MTEEQAERIAVAAEQTAQLLAELVAALKSAPGMRNAEPVDETRALLARRWLVRTTATAAVAE
jgi:hypothetical protein